ncbi:hypothetical protein [Leptospira vanthielii]|uniref:Lipoprotein n=1 Tax=Leptospira vanthielii serovar Holland str. Waz Holland = ATCC 700522 TaxID=1218591 RepID=N1WEQ8_9LEPT|nr:hypothetical protein [Leptospira vanthielii]EMY71702.1 hypothetical protein LEP1GSC199_3191 [Leptospira vanthielii serovar Holland str. Waz Holland = ATCC 700522]
MKKIINKGLVLALIAMMGFASVDCQKKKTDNTGLLLAALFFLNQPEYTVVLTGTLKGADNLPMKDGKVSISDAEGSSFLSGGQGTISDFTSCFTAGAPPASGTVDGEFTLLFKTPSLNGKLAFAPTDAASATNANGCSSGTAPFINSLASSDFTNVTGAPGILSVNLKLEDRQNIDQVGLSGNSGYSITVKSINVFVKGEYTLQSPTVGENVCDGRRLGGGPRIVSGSLTGSETWNGGILLQGTVFVESGVTINVAPGTAIFGQRGSSIFFKRGSKLVANGTAADPICWSSASSLGSRFPGDWGGIVTIGDSGATRGSNSEGTSPQPYGGTGSLPGTSNLEMSYNIVEFGGNEVAPGDELNNLSLYASNTTLNHVQAHRGLDDQIEAWGGTGSWNNILATGGLDDDLDLDEGFGGPTLGSGATITNFISHKYPAACGGSVSTDPHGLEWDGIHSDGGVACNSPGAGLIARCTTATLNKFTLIGAGISGGQAGRLREGVQATLTNGVAYGHALGFRVDTATAGTAATATSVRGQSGQTTTGAGTLLTVTYDITSLPIVSDGGINTETNCGFAATKPDYTLVSGFTGLGGAVDGKWWDGWAVFRAR